MENESRNIEGACLCGDIRFKIRVDAIKYIYYCHCSMCRKVSGSLVVPWITIPCDAFELQEGNQLKIYNSSSLFKRGFCSRCGSQILFSQIYNPDHYEITLGSIDSNYLLGSSLLAPRNHIWMESTPNWMQLDRHLPCYLQEVEVPAKL